MVDFTLLMPSQTPENNKYVSPLATFMAGKIKMKANQLWQIVARNIDLIYFLKNISQTICRGQARHSSVLTY
jgi:hypothetical protein